MIAPPGKPMAGLRFTKQDRVLRRGEFLRLQSRGARTHTPHFTLVLLDRGDGGGPRLGLTTSRKVGASVIRSRIRRLLREVFRTHKAAFPAGHDCVVIVRENVPELTLSAVRDEVLAALARRQRRAPPPGAKPASDTRRPQPTSDSSARGHGRGTRR
jgi:ribonuclease P protein component